MIKADPEKFAILELPHSYDPGGNLSIIAQYYMLFQPYHKKPVVLGYPSRHLRSSLEFTEKTDLIYELTHPWVLEKLLSDPALAERKEHLEKTGAKTLEEARIKYALYHLNVPDFTPEARAARLTLLENTLGLPVYADGIHRLYKVY